MKNFEFEFLILLKGPSFFRRFYNNAFTKFYKNKYPLKSQL